MYKAIQSKGRYVVTFPGAYHGGFSLGYSCAESVNWTLSGWLSAGQKAMDMYRGYKRFPVVSHEEVTIEGVRTIGIEEREYNRKLQDATDPLSTASDEEKKKARNRLVSTSNIRPLLKSMKGVIEEERRIRTNFAKRYLTAMKCEVKWLKETAEDAEHTTKMCNECKTPCFSSFMRVRLCWSVLSGFFCFWWLRFDLVCSVPAN